MATRVHDRRKARGVLDRYALGQHQHRLERGVELGTVTHEQRREPPRVVRRPVEAEPLLLQVDAPVPSSRGDEGEPTLPDPGVHDRAYRLAGRGLERVPQVRGLRVAVRVLGQVPADAVAEAVGAKVPLEHPQDRRSLDVRERVEHAVRVVRRANRVLDGSRRAECVDVECDRSGPSLQRPAVPLGAEGIHADELHERREGLVQPDPVPPPHRHQIAEPHVGDLVGDGVRDAL